MTDRDAIQELMARYADAIDHKDYAGIAACFTENAEAIYPVRPDPIVGGAAIADLMKGALEHLDATTHNFSNFIIEIDGDTARMRANVIAQHIRAGVAGGDKLMGGARYDAQMRKTGGVWKIARVKPIPVWREGNPEVMKKPA